MGLIASPCKDCPKREFDKESCLKHCEKLKEIQLKLNTEQESSPTDVEYIGSFDGEIEYQQITF